MLDRIEGIIALHDRKAGRGTANIDHIAITPGGVWVVDTKRPEDKKVEFRDVGGLFRTDERLFVGGSDRTKHVENMSWQVDIVETTLQTCSPELESLDVV